MLLTRTRETENMLSTAEASNLWDILKSNYMAVELMQIWGNYAHDSEFKRLIASYIKDLEKNIQLLEGEAKKTGLFGPDKNRSSVNTSVNSETLYDEYLAQEFFIFAQENVEQLLRALRTTTSHDGLRKLFMKFLLTAIDRADSVVQYLKMKGWIDTPPLYALAPAKAEKLAAGEAYHLWDHLTYRYDNISQTEIFHAFAKDLDFKLLLSVGLQRGLKQQAESLEKELQYFGIPLPKRPKNFSIPDNLTAHLEDDHMFRMVLIGIQGAGMLHAQALKQCTVNDRIRGIFKQLLLKELDYNNDLIRFGKLKGWLHPVPMYRLM
jgi:hypothetical protein